MCHEGNKRNKLWDGGLNVSTINEYFDASKMMFVTDAASEMQTALGWAI